jgi:hypothetical protein
MRRRPYSAGRRIEPEFEAPFAPMEVTQQEWLTAEEAAIVLKKFRRSDGKPSIGAIHTMIWRKQLTARKVLGRLLFSRTELDRLIALSPSTGG